MYEGVECVLEERGGELVFFFLAQVQGSGETKVLIRGYSFMFNSVLVNHKEHYIKYMTMIIRMDHKHDWQSGFSFKL